MASQKKSAVKKPLRRKVAAAPKKSRPVVRKAAAKPKAKKTAAKARPSARSAPKAAKPKAAAKQKRPLKRPTKKASRGPSKHTIRKVKRSPLTGKKPVRKAKAPSVPRTPNPLALALSQNVAALALEKKALDVVIVDVTAKGEAIGYDYLVIATGESEAQLSAIADSIEDVYRAQGRKPTSIERSPEWVLVNFDDVVLHLFAPDARANYDLEGLWSDAPRVPLS